MFVNAVILAMLLGGGIEVQPIVICAWPISYEWTAVEPLPLDECESTRANAEVEYRKGPQEKWEDLNGIFRLLHTGDREG